MSSDDPRRTRGFRARVALARLVVTAERLWPALWPPLAVLGVFAVFSLFGLWLVLPPVVHVIALLGFAAALAWTLWRGGGGARFVPRDAALARLEQDSGIAHQPLRALDDRLPGAVRDLATQRLWALHRQRLIASLERVRLSPPRSDLPRRDPWAVRAALLLVLVVALVHARGEIGPRLGSAFTFPARAAQAGVAPVAELWITPPAYTRRAPLVSDQTRGVASVAVPTGSEARLQLHHLAAGVTAEVVYGESATPLEELGPGSRQATVALDRDAFLIAREGGREIASWLIDVIPDAAPTVSFVGSPRATHRSVLKIELEAADDYGVAELALLLAPPDRAEEVERLTLLKPAHQPPKVATGTYLDLTAHPMAGLRVELRLEAVDASGQSGRSGPLEIVLPEREFRHPLARAIIAERRKLAADPAGAADVAAGLNALADTPAAQQLPSAVPLSLRVGAARLALNEEDTGARRSVIDLLWDLALFIEDGSLSLAERKLRDLQQELQQALERGAEDAELERLMQELQQAMDEFLQELTRQALEQGQQMQPPEAMQRPESGQVVDRRDLQEMLDRARELMRSGARDAAREMLAQLQEMLENLRAGMQQAQPTPGEQNLSDLQKMIQLQQQLLQRSFEMDRERRQGQQGQQGQQGDQQQGQQQQGQQGQQGQEGQPGQMGQSAAEQEALRRALGELMRRMGEAGMEIPRALGQAEMQMRNARGALEQGQPGDAAGAQAQAVDSMQRAGQAMMEQLQEQMARQQGEGPGGQPQANGQRGRDPLGRATRNEGGMDTRGVEVPEESDLGRARDVLEELYRRAGDRNRPPLELDYFNRLLDRF